MFNYSIATKKEDFVAGQGNSLPSHVQSAIDERTEELIVKKVQSILLRLWVGESVMTSLQGADTRLRLAAESKWSAISSAIKVLRSTSWRPFLRRLRGWAGWVGEPGGPERTEMLAMAPLRPGGKPWKRYEPTSTWQPYLMYLKLCLTVQGYGLSEGLQVGLDRTVSLCGRWSAWRHHGDSWRGASGSWRWSFAT